MNWTLHPISEFAAHASRWAALNAQTLRSPCLRAEFVQALIANFGGGHERLALCTGADGELIAAAVVTQTGPGRWQSFHPSQATLCLWLQREQVPLAALSAALLRALPQPVLFFALLHLDPALLPRPRDGGALASVDYIPTPRLAVDGDFEPYWAARGKNLRQNVRKQLNRMDKEGVQVQCTRLDSPDGVREGVQLYSELESAGWKAELGSAVTPGGAQHRFYQQALEALARAGGDAMVYTLRYGDDIVAVDLCIKSFGTCVILKTTYDERITKTSPALLLRHAYFQELFAAPDVRIVEFYGRVMDWHTKWTDDIRTMYHLNVYRNAAFAKLHSTVRSVARAGRAAPAPAEAAG